MFERTNYDSGCRVAEGKVLRLNDMGNLEMYPSAVERQVIRRRGASMLYLPLVVSLVCNVRFLRGSGGRKDVLYRLPFSVKLLGLLDKGLH